MLNLPITNLPKIQICPITVYPINGLYCIRSEMYNCTHLWQFVELIARLVAVDVYEPALDVEHPVVVLVQEVAELAQQPLVVVSVARLINYMS